MRRRSIGLLVLLAWLCTLGWLGWRQFTGGQPRINQRLPWLVQPGSSFLAATIADSQMGLASVIVDTGEAGLRVDELMRLDPVPPYGAPSRQLIKSSARFTRDFHLRSWEGNVTERLTVTSTSGKVEGDSLLTVITTSNSRVDTLHRRIGGPVITPAVIGLRLAAKRDIQLGDTLQVRVFDHTDLSVRLQLETVAAESTFIVADSAVGDSVRDRWVIARFDTVHAWRLDAIEDGLPIQRWIDPNGLPVKIWTPMGLTLLRGSYEILAINYRIERGLRPADAKAKPVVARLEGVPRNRANASSSGFRLDMYGGQELSLRPIPALADGGQQRFGDTVLSAGSARARATQARDTLEALGEQLLIPVADSAIERAAAAAIGSEKSPAGKSAALIAWIGSGIKLEDGDGVTLVDPRRTLRNGSGDLHARLLLFLAMARAADLPARSVAGLLATPTGFKYHDWAEVYDSGWLAVDPGLGQAIADPGRIRLVTGRLGRESDLVWRVAGLRPQLLRAGELH
ncbi:MAG: transglutaminase-like domain-containing protein [Gemmatimonadota bacterium]